ncbi:GTP-binding protein, partial [bacterium]|nr:GTP-binding protein [bacterium]
MTEKIALIGNPNSGKTTLFNALTGASQRVGNWSGVTVERREGICMVQNTRLHIVDLPGIYTLAGDVATMATDQWVTHSQLTEESWQVIVQVVDATQLARHLYLTIQLRERGFAVILALNMMDVYSPLHPHLDLDKLAHALGCPVIPISASRREGLAALRTAMVVPPCPKIWACVPYPPTIGDRQSLLQLENTPGPDVLIAQARYAWIDALCQRIQMPVLATPKTDRLDHFLLHPVLGIPAFLLILFLMFFLTIQGGSALQPFFENLPRQWIFDRDGWGGRIQRIVMPRMDRQGSSHELCVDVSATMGKEAPSSLLYNNEAARTQYAGVA